jgi:tetratricopeptide (TPR) repeat protein
MKFAHFRFDPVEDLLGEGPLSEVYKAVDERLERTVALKILRAHVEIDPEADERFSREAKHNARLDHHQNIATIYETGVDGGRSYIAMEYLVGRTLDKIIKDKPLPVDESLRVALQLTSALALVHESGLIHRDLKPANVMVLHDGTVKLLDFGIARAKGEATITQHGMLVGTVLYMSPEQVRGDELDARSDVFSFGAVLYHALSGKLPFPGTSFPEVCMAILDGRPAPLSDARVGLPQSLVSFIQKCLQPDPEDRYPDAHVAHGVLLAIHDGLASNTGTARASYLSGSLAIPPLSVVGNGTTGDLAASLRKDIAAELTRSGLSVALLEGEEFDPAAVSDFILRGALKVDGEAGVLDVVLERCKGASCSDTSEVWRERIENADEDEWALQAQLVRGAVRSLKRQLAEHAYQPVDQFKRNPEEAERLARLGHEVLHKGMTKHLLASISLFRRAIEADSQCALAYAGLAESLTRKFLYWDGDEAFLSEAREAARRSLQVDSDCAEAHTSLGFAYHLTGHLVDAQREYRLAIQHDKEEWLAYRLLGALYSRQGNFIEAATFLQRARALKSSYISTYDHLYYVLGRLDRYDEALAIAERGISTAKKRLRAVPDDQDARVHLAVLQARMGLEEEALETLEQARELGPKDGFTSFHSAGVHAALGNPAESLECLKAAQARGYYVRLEQRNSEFDALRGLSEFKALMQ